jgi:15-cis-phytoene desaturase
MQQDADVIVIGSGLAGLCCAFTLARQGKRVLVLEAKDVIGGRTASWIEDGMPVESGLHKFLGVYRVLPRILEEAGIDMEKMLTWVDAVEIHTKDGRSGYFGAAPYHHPLRTLRGILGNTHLIPWSDKIRLSGMSLRLLMQTAMNPHGVDAKSIAEDAKRSNVSKATIDDVLHTLTTGVLFLPVEKFSSYPAFAPTLGALKRGLTMRVGAFNGGMTEVMMKPLAEAIERIGGSIHLSSPVSRLIVHNGSVTGVTVGHKEFHAPHIVLATALHPAQHLLKAALPDHPWLQSMFQLESMSAVTIQCELDKPLFSKDHTHFSNTSACCFAEQVHTTFTQTNGRLSAILYPPDALLEKSPEQLLAHLETAMETIGHSIKGRVKRYRIVTHPHDFYAMKPDSEKLRPLQKTPIPGLTLAGDYTKQPWSASMEGAAISGVRAAQAIMKK